MRASSQGGFVIFLLNLYLSLLVAEGLVYFISALTPAFIIAIALVAGIYGSFMLVEGFFKVAGDISWIFKWLHYIALCVVRLLPPMCGTQLIPPPTHPHPPPRHSHTYRYVNALGTPITPI